MKSFSPNSTFVNPFPLMRVNTETLLPAPGAMELSDEELQALKIAKIAAQDFKKAGDVIVDFADALTDPSVTSPMTVGQHIEKASQKLELYLDGKNAQDLIDNGYYIGPCIVGLSVESHNDEHELIASERMRLALYQPSPYQQQ